MRIDLESSMKSLNKNEFFRRAKWVPEKNHKSNGSQPLGYDPFGDGMTLSQGSHNRYLDHDS